MLTHQAILQLIKQQPKLFSVQCKKSLSELIPTLPDDIQNISNTLANWSKTYPEIRTALLSLVSAGEMGFSSQIERDDAKKYKEELTNALLQSEKTEPPTTTTTPPPTEPPADKTK